MEGGGRVRKTRAIQYIYTLSRIPRPVYKASEASPHPVSLDLLPDSRSKRTRYFIGFIPFSVFPPLLTPRSRKRTLVRPPLLVCGYEPLHTRHGCDRRHRDINIGGNKVHLSHKEQANVRKERSRHLPQTDRETAAGLGWKRAIRVCAYVVYAPSVPQSKV